MVPCYVFVFVLFDLLIRCSGSAPYVIEINAEKYKNSVRLKDTRLPSLVLNEPFTIHVESDVPPLTIRCHSKSKYWPPFVYANLKSHQNYYTFKTNYKATYLMNDTWTCILAYLKNGADAITLNFPVTVKEPGKVKETISGSVLPPLLTPNINVKIVNDINQHVPSGKELSYGLPPSASNSEPFRNTVKEEVGVEQTTEADLKTRQSKALVYDLIDDSIFPFIHINIYGSSGQTYHIIKTLLELNQHYTIRIRVASNLWFSKDIYKIICNKKGYLANVYVNDPLIQTKLRVSSSFYEYIAVITIAARAELESDWECKLENKDLITVLRISSFPVVFKHQAASAPKNLPEVSVNDMLIPTSVTLTDFDAIGEYSFIAGELAKITCTYSEFNYMRLEFGNDTTSQLISTDYMKENLTLIIKLTENLNGSFLICIVQLPTKISRIKLSFIQNTTIIDKDQPQFYINSLPLVPVVAYNGIIRYKYEYYKGETLAIKGLMTNLNNQWFCEVSNNNPQFKPIENQNTHIDVSVTLDQNDDKAETRFFNCLAGKTTVHVSLTPIPIRFYPTITGLSSANTLYSYKKNYNDYRIKYIHPPQKNLSLTCSYDQNVHDVTCEWYFKRKEVTATEPVQTKESKPNHNTIQNIFKPVQNGISTAIECRCQIKGSNKNIKTSVDIYTEAPKSKPSTEIPAIAEQYSTEDTVGDVIRHITDHDGAIMPMVNLTLVNGSNGKPEGKAESTGLPVNKPFKIYIANDFNDRILKHIKCSYITNPNIEFMNADLDKSRTGYVASGLASKDMIWPWRCEITNEYDKEVIDVKFTIKFSTPDRVVPATINVNNEIINTTSSTIDQTEVASGVYQYRTGELVKVTCTRNKGNTMSLYSSLFSTQPTDVFVLTAYIKMTDEYDGLSIDCKVAVSLPPNIHTYIVRLKFSKILNNDKFPHFVVNGLDLIPKKDNDTYEYQYEYYDGETLSITRSMGHGDEPWRCSTDRDYTHKLEHVLKQSKGFNNLTVTLNNDNMMKPVSPRLVCIKGTYMANLEIKPIPTTYYPNIIGLSLANTLYRYEQSKWDYKIKYSHPDNQNLSLTCASYMAECKWDISNNEVTGEDYKFIKSQGMLRSKRLFVPREDCNSTTITCKCNNFDKTKYYNTIAEIQCQRTKEEAEMTTKDEVHQPSSPNPDNDINDSKSQNLFELLAIIAGTFVVVFLVILMVVNIIKRKRRLEKEQQSNINYENMPEHNAGAMATPVQWDASNYSQPLTTDENPYSVPYVEKNIENMYAKPQPKGQRAPPETLYAEIEAQGEPNYAAVGRQGTSKGQGLDTEYANSQQNRPTYGQVLPKSLRKPQSAPQVLPKPPKSDNYAEVLPKSERNRPDGTNYTNVFENPRYGNMETKTDYAEPAYCELNPWK